MYGERVVDDLERTPTYFGLVLRQGDAKFWAVSKQSTPMSLKERSSL